MRTLLLILFITGTAFGQGVRWDSNVTTSATNVPAGAQSPVYTVPFSRVTVCGYPATGSPCTNVAQIYSDQALTHPVSQPIKTDSQGRFGFWIAPGIYSYSVATAVGTPVGTFPLSLNSPPGPQGPGGIGCGSGNCIVQNPSAPQTVNNRFILGGQVAARTFLTPELFASITDTSPATTNPNPQADLRLTPFFHMEMNDNAPNDAAPIYAAHNCNYTTGPAINNGGCVAMVPIAASTATDEHAGIEAINAIVQVGNTDPVVQAQGIELNMFNNSGTNSTFLPAGTFSRGPYFGISSTAGGNNEMIAAFNVQDQSGIGVTGSGWQYGLFVQRALEAGISIIGSPVGLKQGSTARLATPTQNFGSIPIELDSNFFNGSVSEPFATILSSTVPAGSTPDACFNVGFTFVPSEFSTCADGATSMGGSLFLGGSIFMNSPNTGLFLNSTSTDVEIGSTTAANPPYVDFHSSGNAVDYDTRIQSTGGTTALGQGTLSFVAAHLETNGAVGVTASGTSCTITSITNGLITGAHCP